MNPATGEADFVLMSESREIEIGQEMHEKLMASAPIYEDEELQAYLEQVGQKVAENADRPDLDYTFTIIDSPDINAFALPGGFVYVNRGLLGYLQSEAQLAAVLAHEIGHITARHGVRRDTAQKGAGIGTGILSVLSVLTTGTNVVGDVANLYASAAVMGYGREMELEADRFGAQYLYNSGYDPQAMVEVIGVLKNHERFMRLKAQDRGEKRQTYHGVFSSHPRNDERLRQVVGEAGKLAEGGEYAREQIRFRQKTEGLVFGRNFKAPEPQDQDPRRYVHARLGFTLLFPEGWEAQNQRSAIVATPDDDAARLTLEVDRLQSNMAPSQYIRSKLGINLLTKSEPFSQFGLIGHTGLRRPEGEGHPERIAVLYQGNRVYIFTGTVNKADPENDYDALFLESIRSFQPIRVAPANNQQPKKIHYVRANENTTFAALARLSGIRPYAEEELRLLNNYYPSGEPDPGEWIKIVK
ncbi:M48 family metalloprotease [Gilvimarinus sp. F26214L]|uniref:M48 family metalloprotease n=1 Tax=Gilvimarinus sp. DZF01 TaxID=3461371 RepID=UPI00404608FC